MADFEEIEKRESKRFVYDPTKSNTNREDDPMHGKTGDTLTPYYGPTLGAPVIEEIKAWTGVLMALKDGIPKPFDNTVIIDKIIKLEKRTGEDLSILKKCCPPTADIREAKELKPFFFAIMNRIIEIGGLNNYVNRYE